MSSNNKSNEIIDLISEIIINFICESKLSTYISNQEIGGKYYENIRSEKEVRAKRTCFK